MRPIIGLIPLMDENKESYWMLPGYMKAVAQAGATPIMLPLTTDAEILDHSLSLCDGLLLTGGHDVSPAVYDAEKIPQCGTPCDLRDEMESYLLGRALDEDMPILGICRGLQFMNAYLGGTLYQDLPTQHPSPVDHQMTPPYDSTVHSVSLVSGTPLAKLLEVESLGVNSYHHQAVETLAPALTAAAYAPDGLVEAAYLSDKKYALGIQWHPEFSYQSDPLAMKIVTDFVSKCTN